MSQWHEPHPCSPTLTVAGAAVGLGLLVAATAAAAAIGVRRAAGVTLAGVAAAGGGESLAAAAAAGTLYGRGVTSARLPSSPDTASCGGGKRKENEGIFAS